jgi:hypothetical protein
MVIVLSACYFPYQNEKSLASIEPMRLDAAEGATEATAVIRTVR